MTSLYATIAPQFTQDLLTPGLKVGYNDDGGVWQFLMPSLAQRLPLRSIEWKNLVGVTKFIDSLPLNFVSDIDRNELPLVCIYVVKCEEMESYKTAVKPKLAAWIDAMSSARVEWMVLYVPLGTRAKTGSSRNTANSVYKKIFDKIRADFGTKKSLGGGGLMGSNSSSSGGGGSGLNERICKIETLEGTSVVGGAPGQQQQHESQWSELLLKLRHCIMEAFQVKCFQYEEELRSLDAKRNAPGWDFGAFFIAKERLALMYQQAYLQDDAIRHLDELDAIFMNLSESEKKLFQDERKTSFKADDAIFIVSPLALNLRDIQQQIATNRATAPLIQLYCFCRQIRTLYLMGNFPQLLQRAHTFISAFLRTLTRLQEQTNAIEWYQSHLWAIGACLEIAYACELSWNGHDYQVSSASVPALATQALSPEVMARHLGDLLYLARRFLKAYAKADRFPSSTQVQHATDVASVTEVSAWYQSLRGLLATPRGEPFERCVWELSHLASLQFSRAGRHRFAVFLGGECARYHVRHREFESASRLFRSHARQCEEDKWWTLLGDCVRSICSAELALGRSAQAVTVCFSMLEVAQEAKAEIGRAYLEQLMDSLAQSLQGQDSEAKLRMGELIKPKVAVETLQSSTGGDLDHGDVRVTLKITNRFPAGIHVEKMRVRFAKRSPRIGQINQGAVIDDDQIHQNDEHSDLNQQMERRSSSTHSSSERKDLPRLDSLVLEERTAPQTEEGDRKTDSATSTLSMPPAVPHESSNGTQRMRKKSVFDEEEVQDLNKKLPVVLADNRAGELGDGMRETKEDSVILVMEETNVYLYEEASVSLVFLEHNVGVGSYICTSVECVLAGNTFSLLDAAKSMESVVFEIPKRASTLQMSLSGPPLLIPHSVDKLLISLETHKDTVVSGTLEITVINGGELIQLRDAALVLSEGSEKSEEMSQLSNQLSAEVPTASDSLTVAIPSALTTGTTLKYTISLAVGALSVSDNCISEADDSNAPMITLAVQLRYQHVIAATDDVNTEVRRADAAFPLLRPLAEKVRLRRIGRRIFAAIALICNDRVGVVICDYKMRCGDNDANAENRRRPVQVLQDPNNQLRGTTLRPKQTAHFAFTLDCPADLQSEAELVDVCYLHVDLQYTAPMDSIQWYNTLVVPVSLEEIKGTRYCIEVHLKDSDSAVALECAVGEDVVFHIRVQQFGSSTPENNDADGNGGSVLLCLDNNSERDWILVGKQQECFTFDTIGDDCWAFATQKRLLSARVGTLRFPKFHLHVNGRAAPAERVFYRQSDRQILVT